MQRFQKKVQQILINVAIHKIIIKIIEISHSKRTSTTHKAKIQSKLQQINNFKTFKLDAKR